jgi:hypothetical protein
MRRQMNLYLVLAIALGAVSGTTVTPVARPLAAQSAACCVLSAACWRDRTGIQHTAHSTQHHDHDARPATRDARTETPLTGAASPRAPALT